MTEKVLHKEISSLTGNQQFIYCCRQHNFHSLQDFKNHPLSEIRALDHFNIECYRQLLALIAEYGLQEHFPDFN